MKSQICPIGPSRIKLIRNLKQVFVKARDESFDLVRSLSIITKD